MAGYIRQSTFVDGDTITAALFNNEYNQLVNAFSNTSGHKHDGTTAEGPVIGLIGDAGETSPNNKVLIDTTNNYIEFYVEVSSAPVQQLYIADGAIIPVTDSDIDLGTTSLRFKDTYTDTITTTGNATIGGNLTVTGNATISGNLTFGDADTDSINLAAEIDSDIIPNTDGTYDLGSATKEWQDLFIDGTANIDSLVADTADINGGTIDGATIATSDITVGAGKTLDVSSGTLTLADDQISGNKVEGGTIAATTVTTLTSTTGNITNVNATTVDSTNLEVTNLKAKDGTSAGSIADSTGVVTLASSILTTTDINGGTIDGATIATSDITVGTGKTLDVSSGTLTLADNQISGDKVEGGTIAATTITALTYGSLSDGTITIAGFADEDNMVSDSATLVPTQQSVKAYVDAQVTAQDLDFQGDSGGALSIDLDSETLTIAGGTGIDTTGATNTLTVAIDSTVATLTGTQTLTNKTLTTPIISSISNTGTLTLPTSTDTLVGRATTDTLTNKTLTSPVLNTGVSGTAFLDDDTFATATASTLASSESIKAYVDAQVGGVGGGDVVDDTTPQLGGDLASNGNNILFADNDKAVFGASSDLQIYHDGSNSYIKENGTGALNIAGQGNINFTNSAGSETYAQFTSNSSVKLYHDNNIKLTTSSSGIDVTGSVVADGLTVDTSTLVVDATNNRVGIGTDSPDTIMEIRGADPVLTIRDTETGVANANATLRLAESGASDTLGSHFDVGLGNSQILTFGFSNDGTAATEQMKLVGATGNLVLTTNPSSLYFGDTSSGSFVKGTNTGGYLILGTSNTERARLTTTGLGIGTTTADLLSIAFDGDISSDYTAFDVDIGKASGSAITNLKGINVDLASADITGTDEITNLYGAYINNSTAGGAAGVITNWWGIYVPAADADRTTNPVSAYFGDSVGIGVASPTATLDVNGTIKLDGNYPVGTNNVALGDSVFAALTTGEQNTSVGRESSTSLTEGNYNAAFGNGALANNTTGSNNTGIGRGSLTANTTASNNTALGYQSLAANTTGTTNVAVGVGALDANTTANDNTAVGYASLSSNTTGASNTAMGRQALWGNTTASNNTGIGYFALKENTTGAANVAVGALSLDANTTGAENTAVGYLALSANTTADANTAFGVQSLMVNTTGSLNAAFGAAALDANTTGSNNTAMGYGSLTANTTASNNTALGYGALTANTTGNGNTAVGSLSLDANTTGIQNTAVGYLAGTSITTGDYNTAVGVVALQNYNVTDCVAVGTEALRDCQGNRNIGIGKEAGRFITGADNVIIGDLAGDASSFSGNNNTGVGKNTLTSNSSGSDNVAVGKDSLKSNTTGLYNIAIGSLALDANTTASNNTAMGYNSLGANVTGTYNTAVGRNASSATTGNYSTAVGYQALEAATAGANTAVGAEAAKDITSGHSNVAMGVSAAYGITTGLYNVSLGHTAGGGTTGLGNIGIGYYGGSSMTTGSNNVVIGRQSQLSAGSGNNQIVMGYLVTGTGNNNFTFGNQSTDSNIAFGATSITAPSDIRLKEDIQDEEVGLDFINDLRPVTFQWKKEKDIPSDMKAYKEGSEKRTMNGKYNHGFIAQEVKEAIDKHNLKEGFDMWSEDEADGRQRVAPSAIMSVMVKAVQELSSQVNELKAEIQILKGE